MENRRLVSYMYIYRGDSRYKNVGFCKIEVKENLIKFSIALKGIYTNIPEKLKIGFIMDRESGDSGKYNVLSVGSGMLDRGVCNFAGEFEAENILSSGYGFNDVCGIAATSENVVNDTVFNDSYIRLFSFWKDEKIKQQDVIFLEEGYTKKKDECGSEIISTDTEKCEDKGRGNLTESSVENAVTEAARAEIEKAENTEFRYVKACMDKTGNEGTKCAENEGEDVNNAEVERREIKGKESIIAGEDSARTDCRDTADNYRDDSGKEDTKIPQSGNNISYASEGKMESLFKNLRCVDAFCDDYIYDCVEVSPDMLRQSRCINRSVVNNAFLIQGYSNYRHILLGKVEGCKNKYFIGVPGSYNNREKYMAVMFGFGEFKRSHRPDYGNPYFGYWYRYVEG